MVFAIATTMGCGPAPTTDAGLLDAAADLAVAGMECTSSQQCSSGLCAKGRNCKIIQVS